MRRNYLIRSIGKAFCKTEKNYLPSFSSASRNYASTAELNAHQIEHFEAADPSDWLDELNGTYKPLHSFNRVRIPWILAHFGVENLTATQVESPLKGKRILDVGCGAGIVSMALCRLGATVVGLDATEKAIETGQKMKTTLPPELHSNIDFTFATVEQFVTHPENIQSFDAIVASEVVEHVVDLPSFVKSCCKLAKPNSPLFFTTINRTICSRLLAKWMAEDILRLLPQGLHDYDKFVQPEELRNVLVDEQCRIGPVLGLVYNPLLNRWSWSNFTEVNYAIAAYTAKS